MLSFNQGSGYGLDAASGFMRYMEEELVMKTP